VQSLIVNNNTNTVVLKAAGLATPSWLDRSDLCATAGLAVLMRCLSLLCLLLLLLLLGEGYSS
jgi:hypothetical protein